MTNPLPHGSPGASPSNFSTNPAPGSSSMPRRSSYASVVSGLASGSPQTQHSSSRSGALSHLINQPTPPNPPHQSNNHTLQARGSSRTMDLDMRADGGGSTNGTHTWGGRTQLPSSSSQFAALGFGHSFYGGGGPNGGVLGTPSNHSFTPSYLRNSKYMERLAEANKARQAARRDVISSHSSTHGSLSTSSSSLNLHKMAPSHRGMTYDIVEKEPAIDDDVTIPLPSRWNETDKNPGIDIQADGLEVRFVAPSKSHDNEAAAVRADHPMSPQCGIYYYEITIISRGKEGSLIGLGFSSYTVSLTRLPGWESESWAYHGDDGNSFCCQDSGKDYGPKFSTRDVIGCGVNFRTGNAFFTKNGLFLGDAFHGIKGIFYPSVGMKRPGEHIRVNFGQSPFVFDIDSMMAREKMIIEEEINATPTASLHPPLDETSLVQALVAQFLAHDGHIETARAFAEEVQQGQKALSNGQESRLPGFTDKEDEDAVNRQRIRKAVLDGDIDKALKHTSAYYPSVLKDNGQIYFRMRCRKFIEMIRQCSELEVTGHVPTGQGGKATNGAHSDGYEDVFEHEMELDDQIHNQMHNGGTWERMQTGDADAGLKKTMTDETISYGQLLQSEFKDDTRMEVKRALAETFSLMAYADPKNSVVAHLLEHSGRVPVAEELNSAILQSLGKSSSVALERIYQQTEALLDEISEDGGAGAFINVRHDLLT